MSFQFMKIMNYMLIRSFRCALMPVGPLAVGLKPPFSGDEETHHICMEWCAVAWYVRYMIWGCLSI